MRLAIHGRSFAAALAIIVAAQWAGGRSHGQEPKCRCELGVKVQADGLPMLTRLPYIGRLFTGAEAKDLCVEDVERIGIDFDFEAQPGKVIEFHGPIEVCPQAGNACPLTVKTEASKCKSGVCLAAECCSAAKCCAEAKCCVAEGKCCAAGKCCAGECAVVKDEKTTLWEHVAELTAENASLHTAIEGHEAVLEVKAEMFESLAQLMVEKAKLEAKLEMVDHRDTMLKEMVELHAENARLKAQAELAQQKEELLKAQLVTLLENEQLKQRVAELERGQSGEESPVVAEKKQPKAKKVR